MMYFVSWRMPDDTREELLDGWERAVRAALYWAKSKKQRTGERHDRIIEEKLEGDGADDDIGSDSFDRIVFVEACGSE